MKDVLVGVLFLVYMVSAWWAINKIWYSKHIYIVRDSLQFYFIKGFCALFLGWAAIPIALVMLLLERALRK